MAGIYLNSKFVRRQTTNSFLLFPFISYSTHAFYFQALWVPFKAAECVHMYDAWSEEEESERSETHWNSEYFLISSELFMQRRGLRCITRQILFNIRRHWFDENCHNNSPPHCSDTWSCYSLSPQISISRIRFEKLKFSSRWTFEFSYHLFFPSSSWEFELFSLSSLLFFTLLSHIS